LANNDFFRLYRNTDDNTIGFYFYYEGYDGELDYELTDEELIKIKKWIEDKFDVSR
jgi:hypothetical protein